MPLFKKKKVATELPGEKEKKAIEAIEAIVRPLHQKTSANFTAKNILGNLISEIDSAKATNDFKTVREKVKDAIVSLNSEISLLEEKQKVEPYSYKVGYPIADHILLTKPIAIKLSDSLESISKQFGLEEPKKRSFFGKH